jgi:hypothetical protein
LARLISNYYNQSYSFHTGGPKEKPIAKFIGGPKNLTVHWHPIFDKLVYIFGEFHQDDINCFDKFPETKKLVYPHIMNIQDYMIQLFENTDAFIDFL